MSNAAPTPASTATTPTGRTDPPSWWHVKIRDAVMVSVFGGAIGWFAITVHESTNRDARTEAVIQAQAEQRSHNIAQRNREIDTTVATLNRQSDKIERRVEIIEDLIRTNCNQVKP